MTDRFDEIKTRVARRHDNSEDHSPINVLVTTDGVVPEIYGTHQLCIECSDDDTIETLENNGLIDSADGVEFPCAADDVEWLVAEIERLRVEGLPGVMHKVDSAFLKLAISERDHARLQVDRLSVEVQRLTRLHDERDAIERGRLGGRS